MRPLAPSLPKESNSVQSSEHRGSMQAASTSHWPDMVAVPQVSNGSMSRVSTISRDVVSVNLIERREQPGILAKYKALDLDVPRNLPLLHVNIIDFHIYWDLSPAGSQVHL